MSFVVPSVSFAQTQEITVEYVEQMRQEIINILLAEIARLQKIIDDYIALQSAQQITRIQDNTAIGGVVGNIEIEAPADIVPPKITKTVMYNSAGRGGDIFVDTNEPSKIKIYYVDRNDGRLINASNARNNWDDVADEAYSLEVGGFGGSYETNQFSTTTRVNCISAGMSDGKHYVVRIEAIDQSGNKTEESYLRGKKYGQTMYCEAVH
ncbi:MAG: hypothetical protein IPM48_14605 [Saprospiraceae bacterium]|nr:hypothetical protein [Saprospiraceae bacterium]